MISAYERLVVVLVLLVTIAPALEVHGALSDQCGSCASSLLATLNDMQIPSQAIIPVPLLQLLARGNPSW